MKIALAFVTAVGLTGGSTLAVPAVRQVAGLMPADYYTTQAQVPAKRLVVGIDLSKSNPLIADPSFAAKVGARIADEIRGMGFASEVHVRTFGNYDASSNNFHFDAILSTRNRPDYVADEVEKLISGTPLLVREGKWRSQGTTNALAFLDNVSQSVGCSGMPTTVVLASDGIEDSEYARLEKADSHLPPPSGRSFSGCASLQILGLGEGADSPSETVRLRGEWARWAKGAGFKGFQGLNDW